jgi:hypothetical protein
MEFIDRLRDIRDEYLTRLEAKQVIQGMSWPQSEEFLRRAIADLCELIAQEEDRAAASAADDVEWISQAVT